MATACGIIARARSIRRLLSTTTQKGLKIDTRSSTAMFGATRWQSACTRGHSRTADPTASAPGSTPVIRASCCTAIGKMYVLPFKAIEFDSNGRNLRRVGQWVRSSRSKMTRATCSSICASCLPPMLAAAGVWTGTRV